MPELPEVETVTSGLNFAIKNLIVKKVLVKRYDLRIKVSDQITSVLNNIKVTKINKVSEGRPHLVDAIKDGLVNIIFNTTEVEQ